MMRIALGRWRRIGIEQGAWGKEKQKLGSGEVGRLKN
jgi:hypothetical protein